MNLRAIHPDREGDVAAKKVCQLCGAVEDPNAEQQHTVGICRQRVIAQRTYWRKRAIKAEDMLYRWADRLQGVVEDMHALPPREKVDDKL